jgi:hypothetical protein
VPALTATELHVKWAENTCKHGKAHKMYCAATVCRSNNYSPQSVAISGAQIEGTYHIYEVYDDM